MEAVWVALVEGILSVVGICVTVIVTNRKSNQKQAEKADKLEAKVDKLAEHDKEQYLALLRLTVMSSDMPVSERIIAGAEYVKKGGNGEVKKYYQKLLEEHTM